jgi:NAD(P)H-dependent FMN reductase
MSARLVVALNGSPVRGSSVDLMLQAIGAGAAGAGAEFLHLHCNELNVRPCQACGPEPTTGYCVFHDDMDQVYAALERAHAVAIGSPIFFDGVSGQLKLVMDRCNCVTPLVRNPGAPPDTAEGWSFRVRWQRTRRGVFVTAHGPGRRYDLAERSVRGFMKWVGTKWEETIAFEHADNETGSVARRPERLELARRVGRRLAESARLVP